MSNFKLDDIIVYRGKNNHCGGEIGRLQKVVYVEEDSYHTEFLDNGDSNDFAVNSIYCGNCMLFDGVITYGKYDNGVPIIWED